MYRTILHIDLDYFYAQIEETKDPTLKDIPVVVCQFSGRTEDSGAVATSNYIARKYGVKSGMPIITAKKLLTKHKAAFIDADDSHHALYESISTQIMSIVRNYGTAFENISIDEGCIDITKQSEGNLDKAREIAFAIKSDLAKEQNLTCSIGISPNKLISKMAADHQKPNGLTVIDEDNVKDFLFSLELKKLHEWLCINRLSLNISKTNFVIFHAINKPKFPITILINKKAIDEVKYVKYLGVLIDSHLSFKFHIDELTKKFSRGIGILYKLRHYVTTKILTNVYYAIIYPFFCLLYTSTSPRDRG